MSAAVVSLVTQRLPCIAISQITAANGPNLYAKGQLHDDVILIQLLFFRVQIIVDSLAKRPWWRGARRDGCIHKLRKSGQLLLIS